MDTPLEASLPPPSFDPPRRLFLRLIHDRNPFFLLSAVSMFVGFRIVLAAVNAMPGDLNHLLILIVTLNIYEAMLIALGLFLIIGRRSLRDGWILLTIEAVFLVDLTNLNAEFFSASPGLGSIVSGICLLLAMIKILIITRALGLNISRGKAVYIAAQMAFLLALPGLFKLMTHDGRVTPLQIYAVWWSVALLILMGAMLVRTAPRTIYSSPMAALPWRLYVMVPLISLLVHLCGENRVYWVHFNAANVAPVLLALVVAMNRAPLMRWHPAALGCSLAMVVTAITISLVPAQNVGELHWQLQRIEFAPLRLTLIASALLLLWLANLHRSRVALGASLICSMFASLGVDVPTISGSATRSGRWWADQLQRLIPQTPLQWGYAAIAIAFVLLGVGATISLRGKQNGMIESTH